LSDSLEKLFYELISINSSNPDYSSLAPGEEEIGNFIYDLLCRNNIDCSRQKAAPGRYNIMGFVKGNENSGNTKSRQPILLCSHLDTVYLEGMRFEATGDEEYIYGPGACDTKSSLAAMIRALIEYSRCSHRNTDVFFIGAASEESRHLGIRKFISSFPDITGDIALCIIGEPTSIDTGIAHKGSLKLTIKTEGRSAHGSMPHLGVNAINMMSEIIYNINKRLVPTYEEFEDKLLGHATLNIGVINGGTAFNIVPNFCSIEIDRRVLPSESVDIVLKSFKNIILETGKGSRQFSAEIEKVNDYIPALKTDPSLILVRQFIHSCKKINKKSITKGLPYATDGGFTFEAGIPTIVFGPGDIKNCHKLEEYVSKKELLMAFEVLKDFLFNFQVFNKA